MYLGFSPRAGLDQACSMRGKKQLTLCIALQIPRHSKTPCVSACGARSNCEGLLKVAADDAAYNLNHS